MKREGVVQGGVSGDQISCFVRCRIYGDEGKPARDFAALAYSMSKLRRDPIGGRSARKTTPHLQGLWAPFRHHDLGSREGFVQSPIGFERARLRMEEMEDV